MTNEELDMHEIPATLAAKAMGVPLSTVYSWLASKELAGTQTITGRWWVSVRSCRELIQKRSKDGGRTEARFDSILREKELPEPPFTPSINRMSVLISG